MLRSKRRLPPRSSKASRHCMVDFAEVSTQFQSPWLPQTKKEWNSWRFSAILVRSWASEHGMSSTFRVHLHEKCSLAAIHNLISRSPPHLDHLARKILLDIFESFEEEWALESLIKQKQKRKQWDGRWLTATRVKIAELMEALLLRLLERISMTFSTKY